MLTIGQRAKLIWRLLSGHYEGAQYVPYRSTLPGARAQDAKKDLSPRDRIALMEKARYFERNNALVNRICDLFETYVVGPGIQFFPASSDVEWNVRAKVYIDGWKPWADLGSLQGFDTLQSTIARALVIDGEIFVVLTSGTSGFPRIQLLESHRCATPPDKIAQEGKTIVDGVGIDRLGRPVGYWFTELDQSGGPLRYRFVDAPSIVHVFEPGRTAQYRGVTMLYPCMRDLHDLDDLQFLEMKAARDAAEITNVLQTASGGLTTQQLIALGGEVPSTTQTKENLDATFVGGRNLVLGETDKFAQFKNERPSVVTREFWDELSNRVCQGVGIPLQIVDPSSQQGTTFRAAVDSSAAWFRCRCEALSVHLTRIIHYVLGFGINTDVNLADPPADWIRLQSRPPRALCVDLNRNSYANVNDLAAGLVTMETLQGEQGRDWRREITQRAVELAFVREVAARFGLKPEQLSAMDLPKLAEPMPAPAEDAADMVPEDASTN